MSMMPTMAGGDSDDDRAGDVEEGKGGKKKKAIPKASSGNFFDDLDSIVVRELALTPSLSPCVTLTLPCSSMRCLLIASRLR
jgi:hypothetical protein